MANEEGSKNYRRVDPSCQTPGHYETAIPLDRLLAEVMRRELEGVHRAIQIRLDDVQIRLRWRTFGIWSSHQ